MKPSAVLPSTEVQGICGQEVGRWASLLWVVRMAVIVIRYLR